FEQQHEKIKKSTKFFSLLTSNGKREDKIRFF
ncbi:MAG: hypothetical protein UZ11_BCD004002071, partial [Bacteroidetes bacterium OLB11]